MKPASEESGEGLPPSLQHLPFTPTTPAGQGHSKHCYPPPPSVRSHTPLLQHVDGGAPLLPVFTSVSLNV